MQPTCKSCDQLCGIRIGFFIRLSRNIEKAVHTGLKQISNFQMY